MTITRSLLRSVALLVVAFQLATDPTSAATYTWIGNGSDPYWTTAANWLGAVPSAPGSTSDVLVFSGSPLQDEPVQDIPNYTLNSLQFDSSADGFELYTINGGLIFDGASPTILQDSGVEQYIESCYSGPRAVQLAADTTFTGTGELWVEGQVTGPGGLVKMGTGLLVLTGVNTYQGGTAINAGMLGVESDSSLGDPSGSLTFDGGMLVVGPPFTSGRTVVLNAGGGTFAGDPGEDLTLAGSVTGIGRLTKIGDGVLTLSGMNTYAGGTTINGGTLQIAADDNLGDPSGGLTFDGGTLRTTSHVTSSRPVTLNAGGGEFNGDLTLEGGIMGVGSLTKSGWGTLTLAGSNSYGGATIINQGTLRLAADGALPSGTPLTFGPESWATLNLNGFDCTVSDIGGEGNVSLEGGILTIDNHTDITLSASIDDWLHGGGLTKSGSGQLTMPQETIGYTGPTTVSGGRLIVTELGPSISFTADPGGTLRLDGTKSANPLHQAIARTFRARSGGAIEYHNATVRGGYLRGPGTHTVLPAGATFNGTTSYTSTDLQQNGATTLINFTNGGQITNNAVLTWDGGLNISSGRLIVNDTAILRDVANDGQIIINSGGILNNSISNLVSGGGSRIAVNSGGQLNADSGGTGTSLDLHGGLLVNNGTITGTTDVYYAATAMGCGAYGPVNVYYGGKFIPCVGALTVTVDGNLEMEDGSQFLGKLAPVPINLVAVTGDVALNAGSTLSLQAAGKLGEPGEKQRTIIGTPEGSISGDFTHKPGAEDYLGYGVFYRSDAKTVHAYNVTVFQAMAGDTDGDGDVDPTDLSKLVQNWAPAGTDKLWPEGNFDDHEDGNVDPSDLSLLVQNWAPAGYLPEGAPPMGSATAVPEPGTLLLLAVGVTALLLFWRRNRAA